MYIEGLTENLNRTVADVRYALSKNGGNLGTTGSVGWMFAHKGEIVFDSESVDEGVLMEAALDAGAEDLQSGEGSAVVYTQPGDFQAVCDALRARGLTWESAELAMVPDTTVRVEGPDAVKLVKLIDALEDLDDVQKVYTNADIDEDSLVGA
jgi:YebC/PmpR family DNA-binding regulatory protein